MEWAFKAGEQSLRLIPADPAFYSLFQQALNASYLDHSEFLPWPREYTNAEQALEFLLKARKEFNSETGERRWLIVTEDGQALIGCIGLKPRSRNRYVVGYWANTEQSGKGYMRAALTHLLNNLPEFTFYLTASSANARSRRLAEAVGFVLIRIHPRARQSERHGEQDTCVYRLPGKTQAKKSPQERGRTVVS